MTRFTLPLLAVLAACATGDLAATGADHPALGQLAPEFELVDLNPTSATAGQFVAPSDFRGQVSAWYFTHST